MNLHALVWPLHAIQSGFGATDDKDYNQGILPTDIDTPSTFAATVTGTRAPRLWLIRWDWRSRLGQAIRRGNTSGWSGLTKMHPSPATASPPKPRSSEQWPDARNTRLPARTDVCRAPPIAMSDPWPLLH
ncbi:uncharacterized protein PG998_000010 [Apiospora kogelbergensis]|uniref:uncharacterized protein n=1 Tax=Apiospora kogelbergensis TaxID=1337665 RepID=UPI003131B1E6